ncbi:MAG: rod shape-determining protein MreC [Magnetococcales bacterium]|nr:rod shape-determining protein MreC [Magnetococcales bacterium]
MILLKHPSRQLLMVSVALLAALLLLTFSSNPPANSLLQRSRDTLQEWAMEGISPLLRLFQTPVAASQSLAGRIQGMQHIEQENHKLKLELDRLNSLSVRLEELSLENQRLRLLLGMRPSQSTQELVARIIGNTSSAFARSFLIDAGQEEGVNNDTTVLGISAKAGGGLLGRVVQSSPHSALILALPDYNSRIPVMVQRSRIRAIVSGRNKPLLEMEFVPKGSDIKPGDLVITSGVGGIFPKGIPVGRIHAIAATEETGMFHLISVKPLVDFDRVEEVRLLLNPIIESASPPIQQTSAPPPASATSASTTTRHSGQKAALAPLPPR